MNDPNAAAINTPKINTQLDHLKRLRAAPDKTLPMGWEPGQVPPPAANAMVAAGLARIEPAAETAYRVVAV